MLCCSKHAKRAYYKTAIPVRNDHTSLFDMERSAKMIPMLFCTAITFLPIFNPVEAMLPCCSNPQVDDSQMQDHVILMGLIRKEEAPVTNENSCHGSAIKPTLGDNYLKVVTTGSCGTIILNVMVHNPEAFIGNRYFKISPENVIIKQGYTSATATPEVDIAVVLFPLQEFLSHSISTFDWPELAEKRVKPKKKDQFRTAFWYTRATGQHLLQRLNVYLVKNSDCDLDEGSLALLCVEYGGSAPIGNPIYKLEAGKKPLLLGLNQFFSAPDGYRFRKSISVTHHKEWIKAQNQPRSN